MASKRSRNPVLVAFGARLVELRGKVTRERVSQKLASLGVPLGGSTLAQYEKGTVWAPDPCVLWGLSRIYKDSLERLTDILRENRKNPAAVHWRDLIRPHTHDLTRQPSALESPLYQDDTAGGRPPVTTPSAGVSHATSPSPSLRRSDYVVHPTASGDIAEVVKFLTDIAGQAAELAAKIEQGGPPGEPGEQTPAPPRPEPGPPPRPRAAGGSPPRKRRII